MTGVSSTRAWSATTSLVLIAAFVVAGPHPGDGDGSEPPGRGDPPPVTDPAADGTEPRVRSGRVVAAPMPLRFEPNLGQTDPRVRFLHRGSGYDCFLTDDGFTARMDVRPSGRDPARPGDAIRSRAVRVRLLGSLPRPEMTGEGTLPGKSHYFLGSDPGTWTRNVPHVSAVRAREVYRGIDLVYHGRAGEFEYDFEVGAEGDPRDVALEFVGVDGLSIDAAGDLVVAVDGREWVHRRPLVYQDVGTGRVEIPGEYELAGDRCVRFRLGAFDETVAMVIDPRVDFATYLGGASDDQGNGVAVDATGAVYVTGQTSSSAFPVAAALDGTISSTPDAFVTKFNSSGSALVYSTYLGGSASDRGHAIAVDADGSAHVAGSTSSSDFPVANAFDGTRSNWDAFLTKLGPDGSALAYSTFLGGSGNEDATAVALDADGRAIVAGATQSDDFPTVGTPIQAARGGGTDVFVTKFHAAGSELVFSTYLGGSSSELHEATANLALDASGNVLVATDSYNSDYPVSEGAFQETPAGNSDILVWKLDPAGSAVVWSTFLGGTSSEYPHGIGADPSGNVWIGGHTESADFPTMSPFQADHAGGIYDCFVAVLNPGGTALTASTYYGGSAADLSLRFAVDGSGNGYLFGRTESTDMTLVDPVQSVHAGGGYDTFLLKVSAGGGSIGYSTLLGGSGEERSTEYAAPLAVTSDGDVFVTATTSSSDLPAAGTPFQSAKSGGNDAFVVRITEKPPVALELVVRRGSLVDSEKEGKDKCKAVGTFVFSGAESPPSFDPATDDLSVSVGGPDDPFELRVPAADPGWKSNRARTAHRWKSPRRAAPKEEVVVRSADGQITVSASKFDFGSAQRNPIATALSLGVYSTVTEATWTEGDAGEFSYREPK